MGVLAPGSAHARPSARPPIDTSGNFPAPVSAEWPSAFKTVKNLEPYDNPFWGFSNGGKNKKMKKYGKFPLTPMGVLVPG